MSYPTTITRAQLKEVAELMISQSGVGQEGDAAGDLRKSAEDVTRVWPATWWIESEKCGCLVGRIVQGYPPGVSRYSRELWMLGGIMPTSVARILDTGDSVPLVLDVVG